MPPLDFWFLWYNPPVLRLLTLLGVLTLSAGIVSAQSLGEIARRDRERRASLGQPSRLLTNEDFRRERILQPAHEAAPQPVAQPSEPAPGPPASTYAPVPQTGISLGEYARRLREQRAARDLREQLARSLSIPPAPVEQLPDVSPAPLPAASSMRFLSVSYESLGAQPAVSLGEYARRLREQREALQAQTQPAVAPPVEPGPARTAEPATGVSLGEYARRLQAEKRKQSEPPPADSSAGVPLNVIGVQRGDSLWKLSAFYLGNGSSWVSLWKANPQVRNPNLIHPGQLLRLPESSELARSVKQAPKKAELAGLSTVTPAQALPSPAAPEAAQGAGIPVALELPGEVELAGLSWTASEIFT